MRKILTLAALAALALGAVSSCKVSEKNYRQAYERAVAGDSARTDIRNTVYGSCTVAPDQAATPDSLHRYNVCVASFKQRFNANSLRTRLEQNGYAGAMVLQTTEPFYYVVALSTNDVNTAAATLQQLVTAPPFRLSQTPFILIPRLYR